MHNEVNCVKYYGTEEVTSIFKALFKHPKLVLYPSLIDNNIIDLTYFDHIFLLIHKDK